MPIRDGRLRFGYDGDGSVGQRLIDEVRAGRKTATCMPLTEYDEDLLAQTRAAVGSVIDIVDGAGRVHCQVRVTDVYETVSYDLDAAMLRGEGYGSDADAFLAEHLAERSEWIGPSAASNGVAERLAGLPRSMRAVLWLYDTGGFTIDEIGELFDLPEAAVRAQLRRARVRTAALDASVAPSGSCAQLRGRITRAGQPIDEEHVATCAECAALAARLAQARVGTPIEGYHSLAEEQAISAILRRPAVLNTVFVVTTFVLV